MSGGQWRRGANLRQRVNHQGINRIAEINQVSGQGIGYAGQTRGRAEFGQGRVDSGWVSRLKVRSRGTEFKEFIPDGGEARVV